MTYVCVCAAAHSDPPDPCVCVDEFSVDALLSLFTHSSGTGGRKKAQPGTEKKEKCRLTWFLPEQLMCCSALLCWQWAAPHAHSPSRDLDCTIAAQREASQLCWLLYPDFNLQRCLPSTFTINSLLRSYFWSVGVRTVLYRVPMSCHFLKVSLRSCRGGFSPGATLSNGVGAQRIPTQGANSCRLSFRTLFGRIYDGNKCFFNLKFIKHESILQWKYIEN